MDAGSSFRPGVTERGSEATLTSSMVDPAYAKARKYVLRTRDLEDALHKIANVPSASPLVRQMVRDALGCSCAECAAWGAV